MGSSGGGSGRSRSQQLEMDGGESQLLARRSRPGEMDTSVRDKCREGKKERRRAKGKRQAP